MHPVEAARRKRKWTQVKLSEESGISQPAISKVERGEVLHPHKTTRVHLSAALGYKVAELFSGDTPAELRDIMSGNGGAPHADGTAWWQRVEMKARRLLNGGTPTERRTYGRALLKVLAASDPGWRDPERGRDDLDDIWMLANELTGTTFTAAAHDTPAPQKPHPSPGKAGRTAPRARARRSKAARRSKRSAPPDGEPDDPGLASGRSTRRRRS